MNPELFYYDKDGNLTNDGRWLYTWDAENRLTSMTSTNTPPPGSKLKLDFVYDWQGRRIQKLVSTNNGSIYVAQYTNRFVYDGWNLLAVLKPDLSLVTSFTWGLDLSGSLQGAGGVGGLLALNDTANGVHFCAYDGNGNLAALVKASDGTVSGNWEYGPFGEVLRQSGLMAKANPFRFSTKYQDDESDNLYYGYRSYNPSTGRWLSRDPIEEAGGANLYGFVQNDPNSQMDNLGLAFYAIDGTTIDESDRANPWWLVQQTAETPRYYYRGPKLDAGGDSMALAFRVHDQICEDFCAAKKAGNDLKINLTGWSRGAVVAAGVTQLLNGLGCACREPCGVKFYKSVKVNWVGLFDAVSKMGGKYEENYWPKTVPANVAHFDHAIRTGTDENWKFPTWHFTGGTEKAFNRTDGSPTTHGDIGRSKNLGNNDSFDWIKSQAVAAGVAF